MTAFPAFISLIALLLLGSVLVYLGDHLGQRLGWTSAAQKLALLILLAAWLPYLRAVPQVQIEESVTYTFGKISLTFDGLSMLLTAVVLSLGTVVVLFSAPYMAGEPGQNKYYAMLVAMIGVITGLGCATDLFNLWIWFEAMAVSSYLLVAFYKDQPFALEAGFKYLVQSAAGSVLVLLGIGLVLGTAGTLDLAEVGGTDVPSSALIAAGALFIIGFGVKTALVPLHTWLPDAHSQAPSGISAMLSGIVIEAGLLAMLRALGAITPVTINWGVTLMAFGAINMLAGNLMALQQQNVKRLFAYSSLAHMGYMLLGLGIAMASQEANGAQGGLFHLFNHGLMKGLAFLAAGTFLYALHLAAGDHSPLTTRELSGAAHRYPWAALALSVAVLGLGGLPPLAGFMSEWQIFSAGFLTHNWLIGLLVIFAAINSVFSLAYYVPLVNTLYRHEQSQLVQMGRPLPLSMNLTLMLMALVVIAIGIWPGMMRWLTVPAGAAFMSLFNS